MYKTLFSILVLFVMSCTSNTSNMKEEKHLSQQPGYVMDDSLSIDYYIDMKGYIPVEGFVPTADVAVKIAECVLFEIYGKDNIEKEKPFSVNLRDGIWIIEGNIPNMKDSVVTFCGQAYMEIKKSNGEILKLLHTK